MALTVPATLSIAILSLMIFHGAFALNHCSINVKNGMHNKRPPTVVETTTPRYVYPSIADPANVVLLQGKTIGVYCAGKSDQKSTKQTDVGAVLVNDKRLQPSANLETIQCVGGDRFLVRNKVVPFRDISCEEKPRVSYNAIMKKSGKCSRGNRYEIGYDLGSARGFLGTIDLCHDENTAKTLWAHGVVVPVNQEKYRSTSPSKSFKAGTLFADVHMSKNEPYKLENAHATLTTILGSVAKANLYISTKLSDRKYLAKGHLVANADKIYKSEQDSTYFYANAVPMWQQINANPGNWFFVEEYVRHLAFNKGRELDIYAGGLGVLELESNRQFHLHLGANGNNKIPVPRVLYKCALDKVKHEAICFLVANDPYKTKTEIETAANGYTLCKKDDRCKKITDKWQDTTLGYLYCCELKDFYDKNHAELGLDDLRGYVGFTAMELLTMERNKAPRVVH